MHAERPQSAAKLCVHREHGGQLGQRVETLSRTGGEAAGHIGHDGASVGCHPLLEGYVDLSNGQTQT